LPSLHVSIADVSHGGGPPSVSPPLLPPIPLLMHTTGAGESMKMATGSDGFVYTPNELETYSPLHALHVTNSKATLNTRNFTLNVSGDKVVFRTEEGSKKTESAALAKDLRDLLTETANNQVKDVMTGEPMELDDMLVRTEEVLKKYE